MYGFLKRKTVIVGVGMQHGMRCWKDRGSISRLPNRRSPLPSPCSLAMGGMSVFSTLQRTPGNEVDQSLVSSPFLGLLLPPLLISGPSAMSLWVLVPVPRGGK